ncbi:MULTISPECIES: hypothetical protein [Dyella]|uniref:Uncharacterized protein n=2 Tax=Dyella TaxID=231454 RepID=A0A4R0YWH7_9GAMM|nr:MULTISPECIES: hypothetical protein [Dyella]TBR39513.1 hypothetical protein EYV96_04690 [Dyella terrae]TCI12901.1 hypothetical protein EZM97_06180 [Dyella soli]
MSTSSSEQPTRPGDHQPIFTDSNHVRLLRRAHLIPPGQLPEARTRILHAIALGWLPLPILCLAQEWLHGNGAALSFLTDIAVHARLLIAVPALIIAEYIARPRLEVAAWHFVHSRMLDPDRVVWYQELASSSRKLGQSVWPSVTLGVIVYALVLLLALTVDPREFPAWQHLTSTGRITLAGAWHMLVSLPLLLGLALAWLWRLFIWVRFLSRVAKEGLRLIASHPDHAGGLQFLAMTPRAFAPVALGFSTVVAGTLANRVFHEGVKLADHNATPIITAAVLTVLFISPPLIFAKLLRITKRDGVMRYGMLASHVGDAFEHRWLADGTLIDGESLSQPDFSATTDLYAVVGNVYDMKPAIFSRQTAVMLIVMSLLPFAPIWITAIPLQTILKTIVGMLF